MPPIGGVILARGKDREEIQASIADDPFVKEGMAEYEIIEFLPTSRSSELESWLNN